MVIIRVYVFVYATHMKRKYFRVGCAPHTLTRKYPIHPEANA